MEAESLAHVLVVSFIGQGNINPMLRLSKLLASRGLLVTLTTPKCTSSHIIANSHLNEEPTPIGTGLIRYEPFDDGSHRRDPIPLLHDSIKYAVQQQKFGRQSIPLMVKQNAELGRPVSCIINNPFIPWVTEVAESLGIPSAMLWIQSCACLAAYYHYHHKLVPFPGQENQELDVQVPSMPILRYNEIPTYLHPSCPLPEAKEILMEQFRDLHKPFCILVETFEELERDIIEYMSNNHCHVKAIGPVFKYPTIQNPNLHADVKKAEECFDWLDAKKPSSVVYISFGSMAVLNLPQFDEIAYGLLFSNATFLWAVKPPNAGFDSRLVRSLEWLLEKAGDKGKIVEWISQEKVLSHPSVACFVTHCGWNSSLEALASGVPIVGIPIFGDQVTNAMYLADVFKVGVRIRSSKNPNEEKLITRDELKRCLVEVTAGPNAADMKQKALRWKDAVEAAVAEGGSSDLNIQAFVDEIKMRALRS